MDASTVHDQDLEVRGKGLAIGMVWRSIASGDACTDEQDEQRREKSQEVARLASRVPEAKPVIETPVLETAVGDDRECGLLVPHRRSQSIVLR